MGGFNTFILNFITFNGFSSSTITRSGGSPINDRISIQGSVFQLASSPSLSNGFNSFSFNTSNYNGAPYLGSSGTNTVTINENEIMRISIAKD